MSSLYFCVTVEYTGKINLKLGTPYFVWQSYGFVVQFTVVLPYIAGARYIQYNQMHSSNSIFRHDVAYVIDDIKR